MGGGRGLRVTSLYKANGDVLLDGVAFSRLELSFSIELLVWGRTFLDFGGKQILVREDSILVRSKSCDRKNCIFPKLTTMGSITGHKINYNGALALRGQRHIPNEN